MLDHLLRQTLLNLKEAVIPIEHSHYVSLRLYQEVLSQQLIQIKVILFILLIITITAVIRLKVVLLGARTDIFRGFSGVSYSLVLLLLLLFGGHDEEFGGCS